LSVDHGVSHGIEPRANKRDNRVDVRCDVVELTRGRRSQASLPRSRSRKSDLTWPSKVRRPSFAPVTALSCSTSVTTWSFGVGHGVGGGNSARGQAWSIRLVVA
jgi:hypothetical protein